MHICLWLFFLSLLQEVDPVEYYFISDNRYLCCKGWRGLMVRYIDIFKIFFPSVQKKVSKIHIILNSIANFTKTFIVSIYQLWKLILTSLFQNEGNVRLKSACRIPERNPFNLFLKKFFYHNVILPLNIILTSNTLVRCLPLVYFL